MLDDGRWGGRAEVGGIISAETAAGLWRPHPDCPTNPDLRPLAGQSHVWSFSAWGMHLPV